jgi:hypothetical protein
MATKKKSKHYKCPMRKYKQVIRLENGDEIELRLSASCDDHCSDKVNTYISFDQVEASTGEDWKFVEGGAR